MYCTYLTIYSGNLLPPYYIGYSTVEHIKAGYHGTVCSKQYKTIWKDELIHNEHLFKTILLTTHESMSDAKDREYRFLKALNVHKNPMYINKAIMGKSFYFDRTGAKATLEQRESMSKARIGRRHSEESKLKISKAKTGIPKSKDHKAKIGDFHRGKIESAETKLKKSLSRIGKTHSNETLKKMSENSGRAKPVEVNGVMYRSLKHAAQILFPDSPDIRKVKRLLVN